MGGTTGETEEIVVGSIHAGARAPRGRSFWESEAELLRRLADQLEGLAEERRQLRRALGEALPPRRRSLPAMAATGLSLTEAEMLVSLPARLEAAARRVRLSGELLAHYLATMSALLRKAARRAASR
jgi:hypothetical protein